MTRDFPLGSGSWTVEHGARVLDAVPAYIFVKDLSNKILFANKAVADSLDVAPEELDNTPSGRWYPETAHEYHRDDLEVVRRRAPKVGIKERKPTAHGERSLETDKFPLYDESGDIAGVLVIARDVTQRQQVESAARMESLGQLALGVAHNLNNALTAVLGHVDAAVEEIAARRNPGGNLATIAESARHAARMTKRLLSLAARSEAPRSSVDLNRLVSDTLELLIPALPASITTVTRLSREPVWVDVDSASFMDVIINLVLNARDAMPNGGTITLSTSIARKNGCEGAATAEIAVTDTGAGIPEAIRKRIFEPFFTTKSAQGGTGLGLSSAKQTVEASDGRIEVASQEGVGTRFAISLPQSASAD